MNRSFALFLLIGALSLNAFSQSSVPPKQPVSDKPAAAVSVETNPLDVAKATLAAHGGDKLKNMKSLVVRGTVDITGAFSQVIPATFMMVLAGDRYVFELNNPFQPLKQVYDGKQKYSSGYELPPMTSLGFPLLPKIGQTGYVISALPEAKKKKKGFRVTTPDGFYTDFLVDEKTSQIKIFESSYQVNENVVTTSVEIDECQLVEGVLVPKRYSQRFDLGQTTFYTNFKTKDILVNSQIADDVFTIPK